MTIEKMLSMLKYISLECAIAFLVLIAAFLFQLRRHKPGELREVIAELTPPPPDTRPKKCVITAYVPPQLQSQLDALLGIDGIWEQGWERTEAPWLPKGGD